MKILLVDDEPFIREVVKKILEPKGYKITACQSVDEGIAALKAGDFSLVITDMIMPDKTGPQFMEHIRKNKIPVPILAVTAGVENAVDDYMRYADLFADEVMAKPFVHDKLIATVERLISESRKKAIAGK